MSEDGRGQIRVLLVDDDELFLASLAELVDQQPELLVSGTVSDGVAALDRVEIEEPDAVVIDLHMPLLDGGSTGAPPRPAPPRPRRPRGGDPRPPRRPRPPPGLGATPPPADAAPALSRAAKEA